MLPDDLQICQVAIRWLCSPCFQQRGSKRPDIRCSLDLLLPIALLCKTTKSMSCCLQYPGRHFIIHTSTKKPHHPDITAAGCTCILPA